MNMTIEKFSILFTILLFMFFLGKDFNNGIAVYGTGWFLLIVIYLAVFIRG